MVKNKKIFKKLTKDDFYSKSNEFKVWLFEHKKIYFDEQNTKKLRKLFKKFYKKWNKKKLSKKYYEGINSSSIEVPSTRHQWKFNLSDGDKNKLSQSFYIFHH